MSKPQVLFLGDLNEDLPTYQQFKSKYEILNYKLTTREQFINDLDSKFSNIVAIYASWLGFMPIGGIRQVISHIPDSLKVVSFCSVGYDHEDSKILADKGIVMTNVPADFAAEPVSDLVLYLTIASFRQFQMYSHIANVPHTIDYRYKLAQGEFDKEKGAVGLASGEKYHFGQYISKRPNLSPMGHNVVIIGFGKIGQKIGKKLNDIGMNVNYVKRNKLEKEKEEELGYPVRYYKKLEEVEGDVDLIVIAAPSTPETQHLINENIINGFKKPIRIINIGRGSIIDEKALIAGLKSGKVLFAGLDVFENEPHINPELLNRQDVILTPHIGASTVENFDYTAVQALKNIEYVIEKGKAINPVY
ncbi:unnamed protein product [Candida verbasci]|uniref:2-hydroxyacid dehydrogenase n=1 Tax=Candida verbasci TaxID=1227364 RepID=A0A9W4XMF4_9ASCO|nr:unnamed protein product [Candida verbasci]